MSLDLNRVLSDEERGEIAADGLGPTWDAETVTVAEVITGMAGIGYGGHYDECSDDEHGIHEIMARHGAGNDDDWDVARELAAIHEARNEYVAAVRAVAESVPWPQQGWKPPATGPYWARCADEAHNSGAYEPSYVDHLEISSLRHHIYFLRRGDRAKADEMMTQTFSQALMGNNGD